LEFHRQESRSGSDGFICIIRILSNDFRIEFLALKWIGNHDSPIFSVYANENRSRYYASFWVESIPVFGGYFDVFS
jgi:hypothetical protein